MSGKIAPFFWPPLIFFLRDPTCPQLRSAGPSLFSNIHFWPPLKVLKREQVACTPLAEQAAVTESLRTEELLDEDDAPSPAPLGRGDDSATFLDAPHLNPVEIIRAASEQGEALAKFEIDECLLNGDGVTRDEERGVAWLCTASLQGHSPSQHALAECLKKGRVVEQNLAESARWFKMAEEGEGGGRGRSLTAIASASKAHKLERGGGGAELAQQDRRERLLGSASVAVGALGFASASLWVRRALDKGFGSLAVAFYVGLVRALVCGAIVLARGAASRRGALCAGRDGRFVLLCAGRAFAGSFAALFAYAAYARLPIGDATSLARALSRGQTYLVSFPYLTVFKVYTSPIWTALIAVVALRERLTSARALHCLLVFAGVALVARAVANDTGMTSVAKLWGALFALGSALTLSIFVVATRKIGLRQDAIALTLWLGAAMVLSTALALGSTGLPFAPVGAGVWAWGSIAVAASVSLIANVCFNWGLERVEATPAGVISSLEVFFAYIFQLTLLHQPLHPSAVAGALLIVTCAIGASVSAPQSRPALPMAERDTVRVDSGRDAEVEAVSA
ncbi:hypothetical protein T492DRAFT_845887 [Pavlovales sp. CCMP2436]|nr:hypothetical protein T492DRAFT_845887 [Pavlovales sp. CCMP2436]